MNRQQIVDLINQLQLSPPQLNLCLKTLENENFSEAALTSVIIYLISLAKINESQAKLLAMETNVYQKAIDLLKKSPHPGS